MYSGASGCLDIHDSLIGYRAIMNARILVEDVQGFVSIGNAEGGPLQLGAPSVPATASY